MGGSRQCAPRSWEQVDRDNHFCCGAPGLRVQIWFRPPQTKRRGTSSSRSISEVSSRRRQKDSSHRNSNISSNSSISSFSNSSRRASCPFRVVLFSSLILGCHAAFCLYVFGFKCIESEFGGYDSGFELRELDGIYDYDLGFEFLKLDYYLFQSYQQGNFQLGKPKEFLIMGQSETFKSDDGSPLVQSILELEREREFGHGTSGRLYFF